MTTSVPFIENYSALRTGLPGADLPWLDALVLGVFGAMKLQSDPIIVVIAVGAIAAVFAYERVFLSRWTAGEEHNGH